MVLAPSLHHKLSFHLFCATMCHVFSIIFHDFREIHDSPVTLMDLDGETCETSQLGEVVPHQALSFWSFHVIGPQLWGMQLVQTLRSKELWHLKDRKLQALATRKHDKTTTNSQIARKLGVFQLTGKAEFPQAHPGARLTHLYQD